MTLPEDVPPYTRLFWAKAQPYPRHGPERVHLLEQHPADVGACFEALLEMPTIRKQLATADGCTDLTDDYSRFILSWKLQRDMTTDSLIEVVQEAVGKTGMTEVPVVDRTSLLSDNGSGYVSRGFRSYLRLVGIQAHPSRTLPPPDQRQA